MSSSNSRILKINDEEYTSSELKDALIYNNNGLVGITNGKVKKLKSGEKYLKLYAFIGPYDIISEDEIKRILKPNDDFYKVQLNSLIKAPGTLNKLPPINTKSVFEAKPPEGSRPKGSRSKRNPEIILPPEIIQVPAPPSEAPRDGSRSKVRKSKRLEKIDQSKQTEEKTEEMKKSKKEGRRKVEITVEQLRDHLQRKFEGMKSIDDIFEYIKARFTKDDLTKFLLKQVKLDLELML
jgi:hypothetical protein